MPSLVLTCVPTHVPVAIGEGNCGAAPQGEAATISNNVRASRTSRIRFGGLPLQGVARPQMVLPGATLWGDANARFGGLPLSGVARPQIVLPGATLWGDADACFGGLPLSGVARPQMVLPGATFLGDASLFKNFDHNNASSKMQCHEKALTT